MAYTQAQINANRKKKDLKPMVKTTNKGGSMIPYELEKKAPTGTRSSLAKLRAGEISQSQYDTQIAINKKSVEKTTPPEQQEIIKQQEPTSGVQTKKIGGVEHISYDGGKTWQSTQQQAKTSEYDGKTPSQKQGEKQDLRSERLREDIYSGTQKLDIQEEELDKQKAQAESQRAGGIESVRGGFAESPEGVTTSTAQGVSQAMQQGITERTQSTFNQIRTQRIQVQDIRRQYERALDDDDTDRQEELIELMEQTEKNIANLEIGEQEAQNDLRKMQMEERKYAMDVLQTVGDGGMAGMSENALFSMAEATGIPSTMLFGMQTLAKDKMEAEQKKDDQAIMEAQQKMIKAQLEIENFGQQDPTKEQQNFDVYSSLLKSDPTMAEKFAQMTGISEKPMSDIERRKEQADINYKNAQTEKEKVNALKIKQGLDATSSTTNGLAIINNISGYKTGDKSRFGRTECGEFVNDSAETPHRYGNSYDSKFKNTNVRDNLDKPQIGDIFTSSIGVTLPDGTFTGHTGFISDVDYNKGTAEITDSNRYGNGQISVRTVPLSELATTEGITGYERPSISSMEEKGEREFTDGQKAILSSVNLGNVTSTTLTMLEDAGLSIEDVGDFLSTEKKQLTPEKQDEFREILNSIDSLLSDDMRDPLTDAVGASAWKFIMSKEKEKEGEFPAGTDASDFATKFMSFRDKLVLPSLDKLKGAMSDKDITFLRNASTELSLAQSEDAFIETLESLKDRYKTILEEGSTVEMDLKTELPQPQIVSINSMIDELEVDGHTEQEIKATLINNGISPSIFYKN